MEDEDLARRLQNLPPELYNAILVEVFTPDTNIHKIDADYKPPKFLAISRTTRDMYAEAYYGSPDSSFVFDLRMGKPLVSWLKCLPSSHMQMLRHMKFIWAIQNVHLNHLNGRKSESTVALLKPQWMHKLNAEGLEIADNRVCVEICATFVNGEVAFYRA